MLPYPLFISYHARFQLPSFLLFLPQNTTVPQIQGFGETIKKYTWKRIYFLGTSADQVQITKEMWEVKHHTPGFSFGGADISKIDHFCSKARKIKL